MFVLSSVEVTWTSAIKILQTACHQTLYLIPIGVSIFIISSYNSIIYGVFKKTIFTQGPSFKCVQKQLSQKPNCIFTDLLDQHGWKICGHLQIRNLCLKKSIVNSLNYFQSRECIVVSYLFLCSIKRAVPTGVSSKILATINLFHLNCRLIEYFRKRCL